jgi:chaperonin GroES
MPEHLDDWVPVGNKHLFVIGERLLVSPVSSTERTSTGLYIPDSAMDSKRISGGWVEAVGPGYPVPSPLGIDEEPWKQATEPRLRFIPLQARKGDYVMYVRSSAYELSIENKKFFVVPYSAVLVLLREDWQALDLDAPDPEA